MALRHVLNSPAGLQVFGRDLLVPPNHSPAHVIYKVCTCHSRSVRATPPFATGIGERERERQRERARERKKERENERKKEGGGGSVGMARACVCVCTCVCTCVYMCVREKFCTDAMQIRLSKENRDLDLCVAMLPGFACAKCANFADLALDEEQMTTRSVCACVCVCACVRVRVCA